MAEPPHEFTSANCTGDMRLHHLHSSKSKRHINSTG